ncbi:PBSX family phage terminase large subunit [Ruminococcus sp.]|uniref:PBSX family phage terminase large subunit n=1 Tax=Ruminococcus sp. TaxID=41978 RepID=UPI0025D10EFF|nr:PBSX family phage terminase large subunit [Ruminococcus sp.]
MKIERLSENQTFVFRWWLRADLRDYDGIICDGAVRSGKTFCLSASFVTWAMTCFDKKLFGLCSKTIVSLRRNVLPGLREYMESVGMGVKEVTSRNYIDVTFGNRRNRFYFFGGRDEGSPSLIQGVTLAGVLLDEAALMPRSFIEQAAARCSVPGSKLWFCCNPDNPYHWFKKEWIDKAEQKRLVYRHFVLEDNPTLSRAVIERYHRIYTGSFYERFVLGKWTAAEGLVYPMFDQDINVFDGEISGEKYVISCDYGTVNPSSFGLWCLSEGGWYRIDEYYYDSRREGMQRTDEEHYKALEELAKGRRIEKVICDPSAASFIECIRRHGKFAVFPAKNDVISGIRLVSDGFKSGKIKISRRCEDTLRELALYRWDDGASRDAPIKEHDHAMDDMRYFAAEYLGGDKDDFFVIAVEH